MGLPKWLSGKESTCQEEMQVWSLGQEDPLVKEMATHCSILAWEIPWTEKPCGLQSMGSQRVGHDLVTKQQNSNRLFDNGRSDQCEMGPCGSFDLHFSNNYQC